MSNLFCKGTIFFIHTQAQDNSTQKKHKLNTLKSIFSQKIFDVFAYIRKK